MGLIPRDHRIYSGVASLPGTGSFSGPFAQPRRPSPLGPLGRDVGS